MGPGPGARRRQLGNRLRLTPTLVPSSTRRLALPPYQVPGSPQTSSAEALDSSVPGVSSGPGASWRSETSLCCECSLASGGGTLDSSSVYEVDLERLRQQSEWSLPPSIAAVSAGRSGYPIVRCPSPRPSNPAAKNFPSTPRRSLPSSCPEVCLSWA